LLVLEALALALALPVLRAATALLRWDQPGALRLPTVARLELVARR
jgi:hypothetical protein